MKKIILDTNFLLIPGEFRVDIFEEIKRIMPEKYNVYIIDKTEDELLNLIKTKRKIKIKTAAKIGLQLIKRYNIKKIKTTAPYHVDRLILEQVKKEKYVVATQDANLKRKLKAKKIQRIVLRKKQYLEIS